MGSIPITYQKKKNLFFFFKLTVIKKELFQSNEKSFSIRKEFFSSNKKILQFPGVNIIYYFFKNNKNYDFFKKKQYLDYLGKGKRVRFLKFIEQYDDETIESHFFSWVLAADIIKPRLIYKMYRLFLFVKNCRSVKRNVLLLKKNRHVMYCFYYLFIQKKNDTSLGIFPKRNWVWYNKKREAFSRFYNPEEFYFNEKRSKDTGLYTYEYIVNTGRLDFYLDWGLYKGWWSIFGFLGRSRQLKNLMLIPQCEKQFRTALVDFPEYTVKKDVWDTYASIVTNYDNLTDRQRKALEIIPIHHNPINFEKAMCELVSFCWDLEVEHSGCDFIITDWFFSNEDFYWKKIFELNLKSIENLSYRTHRLKENVIKSVLFWDIEKLDRTEQLLGLDYSLVDLFREVYYLSPRIFKRKYSYERVLFGHMRGYYKLVHYPESGESYLEFRLPVNDTARLRDFTEDYPNFFDKVELKVRIGKNLNSFLGKYHAFYRPRKKNWMIVHRIKPKGKRRGYSLRDRWAYDFSRIKSHSSVFIEKDLYELSNTNNTTFFSFYKKIKNFKINYSPLKKFFILKKKNYLELKKEDGLICPNIKILIAHKNKSSFSVNVYEFLDNIKYGRLYSKKKKWVRVFNAYRGKNEVFKKSRRRTQGAYLTWLVYSFRIVFNIKNKIKSKLLSDRSIIFVQIRNIVSKFLSALPVINTCIHHVQNSKVRIFFEQNWRGCNVTFKKSRYIKKFKRSAVLKKDFFSRKKYLPI